MNIISQLGILPFQKIYLATKIAHSTCRIFIAFSLILKQIEDKDKKIQMLSQKELLINCISSFIKRACTRYSVLGNLQLRYMKGTFHRDLLSTGFLMQNLSIGRPISLSQLRWYLLPVIFTWWATTANFIFQLQNTIWNSLQFVLLEEQPSTTSYWFQFFRSVILSTVTKFIHYVRAKKSIN